MKTLPTAAVAIAVNTAVEEAKNENATAVATTAGQHRVMATI